MSDTWSLQEMLANVSRAHPELHMLPRAWAAEVLTTVGENISWGNSYSGYSARDVGWALVRVFGHSDMEAVVELVRGCLEATAFYADGSIPTDLQ